jgi:hypothetical protein
MCIAKDYSEQLLELFENINKDAIEIYKQLDEANLIEIDLLHMIEKGGFNASEGYKFAKMIHDNRVRRRQIKNELKPINKLKSSFIDKYIYELQSVARTVAEEDAELTRLTENKVYKPRVLNNPISQPVNRLVVVNNKPNKETEKTYYKKTGEEVIVVSKVSDKLYYVKMANDNREMLMKEKNIENIDKVQLA